MTRLQELVSFLDQHLNIAEIPDYPGALNGLQLENSGNITKIGAAVDASLPVIEKAVAQGVDLLLVHHGMFWQGAQPATKANYRKLKLAINSELAIYSAHIPLDVHPHWGNNAQLALALGIQKIEPFFPWKGIELGLAGTLEMTISALVEKLSVELGGSVHLCPGGEDRVGRVGVITGGAGSEVEAVRNCGIDTFITGEGPHWSYTLAEELGINVVYGGHYATETFGVKALAQELASQQSLQWTFIDHPTGL